MTVSVIICHHQGEFVHKAIASVRRSRDVEFEIIVVTSQAELVCDADRTVHQPGGPAIKRNIGLRYAKGRYIAFFDDDVEIDRDCLKEMLFVLSSNVLVGMVFGKLLNMEHPEIFDEAGSFLTSTGFLWARGDRTEDIGQFEKVEPILAGKSASCMIKRKAFAQVGMFDPRYEILGEETDLAWRVWLAGYRVLFVPKAIALHAFNTSLKPRDFYTNQRVYFNGCRNYIYLLMTNLQWFNSLWMVPINMLCWIAVGFGMVCCGRFKEAQCIFWAIIYNFVRLDAVMIKREKVRQIRCCSDSVLFRIFKKSPPASYYLSRFFRYLRSHLHG